MTTFTTQDRIHAEKDGSFTIDCRPKPLTDEQIIDIFVKETGFLFNDNPADGMDLMGFARAIEKAHGIR